MPETETPAQPEPESEEEKQKRLATRSKLLGWLIALVVRCICITLRFHKENAEGV